jgi:hypothetical protein
MSTSSAVEYLLPQPRLYLRIVYQLREELLTARVILFGVPFFRPDPGGLGWPLLNAIRRYFSVA